METQIQLSMPYLTKEEVYEWVLNYCRRNKIKMHKIYYKDSDRYTEILDDDRLQLTFKSVNQMTCFQRRGNQNYPYFEFL